MRNRTDGNQQEIVDALRKVGASVLVLSQVGGGVPDLLVGWQGKMVLVEVKSEKGDLSLKQRKWCFEWQGKKPVVARNIEDIKELFSDV